MISWLGTIFGILGAITIAANIGFNDLGYIFFLIGSGCCLFHFVKTRDNSNIILWSVFFVINCFGFVSYLK